MANADRWCFAWVPEETKQAAPGKARAALVKDLKWKSGDVITVSFLDGVPSVQERVKAQALKWTAPGMANLTLDFRKSTDTMVRISFSYSGSWSVLGTECRRIPKAKPTMNYGWLTENSNDDEVQRVVLHEFGHALGLIHEHQNPSGGIKWNRDAVIRDLSGPPNSWSVEVIEHNMFEPYAKNEVNATKLDPESIMMYPIPASWTLDGFSVGLNQKLSQTDTKFIQDQYR